MSDETKTAREKLREALAAMRVTVRDCGSVGYDNKRDELAKALRAALELLAEPVADGAALLRDALEAVLQRATARRGMNKQELGGLLWAIEDIAKAALAAKEQPR